MAPTMRPSLRPALTAAFAALPLAHPGAFAQTLVVHHIPQAGLTAAGVPDLPMGERTARWAAQAGLTLQWQPVPFRRSLEELRRNGAAFCVLGVFDVPQRRQHARLSLPLAAGEPQVLLAARRVAARMRALPDVRSAMLDPRFELLAFDGVAYGAELDRWMAERERAPLWVGSGAAQVVPMLARGRADFTVSVPSEWAQLRATAGAEIRDVEVLQLPGMPAPPTRHLACSLRVPAEWLARFDAAARSQPARDPQ